MTHLLSLMDDRRSVSPPSSVTSCSRDSEDVTSKYTRLATQYAQVRAQVVVLKKALLDEREKHGYIKDGDVGKAQRIRTLEQEVDSLVFRNKQLSARVESLQADLDKKGSGGKKKGKGDPNSREIDSIHLEELESKIRENERLHTKLQSIEDHFASKIQDIQDENETLRSTSKETEILLKTSREEFEGALAKEQRHSSGLQVQLDKATRKLDLANMTIQKSRVDNNVSPDSAHLQQSCKSIKCKNLNVYAKDKKRTGQVESTLTLVGGYLEELTTGLLNYCTYLGQRTELCEREVGELGETSRILCKVLSTHPDLIRPLSVTYGDFTEACRQSHFGMRSFKDLKMFSLQYADLVEYLCDVLRKFKQCLSGESMLMSCSIQMEQCNSAVGDSIQPLILAFQNSSFSLGNVAEIVEASDAGKHIPVLVKHVKDLSGALRSHISTLYPKLALCHKLPTVTQRLKTTDECWIASLQAVVNTLTKISRHLSDSAPLLTTASRFSADAESKYTSTLSERCQDYLTLINNQFPTITTAADQDEDSGNRSPALPTTPSTPSPELCDELTKAKDQITKLEQSKEHWMLEAQLLNIKLDKANKMAQEAESVRKSPDNSSNVPVDTLLDLTDSTSSTKSACPWDDSGLREEAIRVHFTKRLNDLSEQIQKAEGECLKFKRESLNQKKRLFLAEKQHNQASIDMCNTDKIRKRLEEELSLTKDKYESQIALMSEHLCALNDKIETLTERNQQLRAEPPTPPAKSGRKFGR